MAQARVLHFYDISRYLTNKYFDIVWEFPPPPPRGTAQIVIVITFYSPSCLGQETAKGPFGLRVKLPPAHLSTTHGGGFALFLLMLNVKQESCEYQFL